MEQPNQSNFVKTWQRIKSRFQIWAQVFCLTMLAAYFYMLMEWIFMTTMPSFMSVLDSGTKLEIYFLAGLVFALLGAAVIIGYTVLDLIATAAYLERFSYYLGVIFPAAILAGAALLLIDNFTYTVFKFGISTSAGYWRGVYAGIFVLLIYFIYSQVLKLMRAMGSSRISRRWIFIATLCLMATSAGLALIRFDIGKRETASTAVGGAQATNLPNIILLGSDGLNADFLSAYGYSKDTTPRLRELADTSLVAENAFTNSANTAGSIVAILTSKLPTQTRLLYPPDILTGYDAYQHLPGILKSLGYQNIEFGTPYYVDANNFNLQNGFDKVNNHTKSKSLLGALGEKLGYANTAYFLEKVYERISDRMQHIFYMHEMENPYIFIMNPVQPIKDEVKVSQLLFAVDASNEPVFIHAHFLGTHGGYYSPKLRLFSKDKRQTRPWMPDFYADTIRGFDEYVGEVVDHLKATGEWDQTILIIYTDHNQQFMVNQRIPLIIHFPEGEFAGKITSPVQNIDIAPTVLDYLGFAKPGWMMGESLLDASLDANRLVFSGGTNEIRQNEDEINFLDPRTKKPPFYQFSYINIINCQEWYSFDLNTYAWTSGDVPNYVQPCSQGEMLSFDEVRQALKDRLRADGFDVSNLP
jgi:hypothetical protein